MHLAVLMDSCFFCLLPASSPCKEASIQFNAKSESKSDSLARVLVKFINSVNEDLGNQRLSREEDQIASIASTAAKGTGEKSHRHTSAQQTQTKVEVKGRTNR